MALPVRGRFQVPINAINGKLNMFWNRDYSDFTEAAKLRQENVNLSVANDELQIRNDQLQADLDALKKKIATEAASASMVIDFTNIDVFSIERNVNDNVAYTTIGHWKTKNDGVKSSAEWVLYCSPETHEKIVEEFKKNSSKK